jgi:hypothetical protein
LLVSWSRLVVIPCLALAALLVPLPMAVHAASSVVECGQISGYTAPDPITPAPGSLSVGLLPPWSIASDAIVSATATANLPSLVGSAPSCFALDLDDLGVITALDFASEGAIAGAVSFDAGLPGYVFADRLYVPTFITDTYPGLAAIFDTSADAGTEASVTFFVDATSGQFTGLEADAAFCGAAGLDGDGNGLVGDATIPAAVLDAGDIAALAGANLRPACAEVQAAGTVDQSGIALMAEVTIEVEPDPTPPDTAASDAPAAQSQPASPIGYLALLALTLLGLSAAARRRSD